MALKGYPYITKWFEDLNIFGSLETIYSVATLSLASEAERCLLEFVLFRQAFAKPEFKTLGLRLCSQAREPEKILKTYIPSRIVFKARRL